MKPLPEIVTTLPLGPLHGSTFTVETDPDDEEEGQFEALALLVAVFVVVSKTAFAPVIFSAWFPDESRTYREVWELLLLTFGVTTVPSTETLNEPLSIPVRNVALTYPAVDEVVLIQRLFDESTNFMMDVALFVERLATNA